MCKALRSFLGTSRLSPILGAQFGRKRGEGGGTSKAGDRRGEQGLDPEMLKRC